MKLIKTKNEYISNQPDIWFVITDNNYTRRSDWTKDIRELKIQDYNSKFELGEREKIIYEIEFDTIDELIELIPEEFL